MPAKSEAQQRLFAIAEHEPGKLHKENSGLAKLSKGTLHDFAATKGLKKDHVLSAIAKRGKK